MDRIDTDFIARSPKSNLIYERQAQSCRKQCLPDRNDFAPLRNRRQAGRAHMSDAAASISAQCKIAMRWNLAACVIGAC